MVLFESVVFFMPLIWTFFQMKFIQFVKAFTARIFPYKLELTVQMDTFFIQD